MSTRPKYDRSDISRRRDFQTELKRSRYLDMRKHPPTPPDLRARLLSDRKRWLLSEGVIINAYNPYDCRTPEWSQFVQLLLDSAFAGETVGVMLHPEAVGPGRGFPPDASIFENYRYIQDAIDLIIASPCTVDVEHRAAGLLMAKFKPVKEIIPHILNTFNYPPAGILESRYPVNSYITTCRIWFKDLHINVQLHRH